MENLEVCPVIEDAAARAGEDTAIGPGRVLLEMFAEECDELGMEGHWVGLTARAVLELASETPLRPAAVHERARPEARQNNVCATGGIESRICGPRRAATRRPRCDCGLLVPEIDRDPRSACTGPI